MTQDPSRFHAPDEHGPLPSPRVPPAEQEFGFVDRLRRQGSLLSVDERWDGTLEDLPLAVQWLLYPNGDLKRVRL